MVAWSHGPERFRSLRQEKEGEKGKEGQKRKEEEVVGIINLCLDSELCKDYKHELCREKICFLHIRTTKDQISYAFTQADQRLYCFYLVSLSSFYI